VAALLGDAFLSPPVVGVATLPGPLGLAVAFASELAISFALVLMVLSLGRSPRWGRYTGLFVGAVLFLYITFEAPLSGMSMNPARTLASALPAHSWRGLWIYFVAPLGGMLLASEVHVRLVRSKRAGCAKLAHSFACIFCGGGASDAISSGAQPAGQSSVSDSTLPSGSLNQATLPPSGVCQTPRSSWSMKL
jgi:aquaporin Z